MTNPIEPEFDQDAPHPSPDGTDVPARPEFPDPTTVDLEIDDDSPAPEKPKAAETSTAAPTPINAMVEENQKLKDQLLRALADAENTRRRADRDRDDAMKYSIANFARNLLTVTDNLRRAIAAIPDDLKETDTRVGNLVAGIEATERDLLSAFDRVGIRKVEAMNKPFNAHQHEVMFEAPAAGVASGTVIQVVEEGYTIHDRLLRPARVGVAKSTDGTAPGGHTVDTQA